MGNSALRELAVIESVGFDDLDGTVVAVDAHNWLYRYLTTTVRWTDGNTYTTADGTEVANLLGIIRGLPKFFEHDLVPVFVFDGAVTDLKAEEVAERRAAKRTAEEALAEAREAGDAIEAAKYEARTQRLTDVIQRTTRDLLELLDVPMVEAPAEGEAQAAHMAEAGDVDYVGTEDYDALLFGAPLTLRQLTSSGDPELMDLEATLESLSLTRTQLVEVAILIGTDFNPGLSGYGPKTALKAIREHGTLEAVLREEDETMPLAGRVRELFLAPDVTGEYEFDTTVSPDIDGARAFVCEEWEIPEDAVESGLSRLSDSVVQTGLDHWS